MGRIIDNYLNKGSSRSMDILGILCWNLSKGISHLNIGREIVIRLQIQNKIKAKNVKRLLLESPNKLEIQVTESLIAPPGKRFEAGAKMLKTLHDAAS